MKTFLILIVAVILTSCIHDDLDWSPRYNSEISIYLVKEGQLEIHDTDIDMKKLKLESTPWIKSSEIEFYDWSAHAFFLNCDKEKARYEKRHFVVTSGNDRLFAGIFWPMYMSSFPIIPAIWPEDGFCSPKSVVRFGQFGFFFPGNMDDQTEFKAALFSAGILREGIKVELLSAKKKGSNAVEYSFKITNRDRVSIYILDPDKMGSPRFHYITNGISFSQGEKYYSADFFNSSPFDKIQPDWYYKLAPGFSITRTVELQGFGSLPTGKVKAYFSFPGSNMNTKEWKLNDGRIWIGDFRIEKELTLQ